MCNPLTLNIPSLWAGEVASKPEFDFHAPQWDSLDFQVELSSSHVMKSFSCTLTLGISQAESLQLTGGFGRLGGFFCPSTCPTRGRLITPKILQEH